MNFSLKVIVWEVLPFLIRYIQGFSSNVTRKVINADDQTSAKVLPCSRQQTCKEGKSEILNND